MFPEQPPVSLLPLETVLPPEPPQSPSSRAESKRQSHQSISLSTLEDASPLVKSLSSISLFNEFLPDEWTPPTEEQVPGHPLGPTQNPQAERMDEEDSLESGE